MLGTGLHVPSLLRRSWRQAKAFRRWSRGSGVEPKEGDSLGLEMEPMDGERASLGARGVAPTHEEATKRSREDAAFLRGDVMQRSRERILVPVNEMARRLDLFSDHVGTCADEQSAYPGK